MRVVFPIVETLGYGLKLGGATSDRADLAAGNVPQTTKDVTYLAIAKRNTPGTTQPNILAIGTNDKSTFYCRSSANGNWLALWNGAAQVNSGVTFTDTDGWSLVGVTHPTGGAVRGHKYIYNTNTWAHSGATTQADGAAVTGGNILGNNNGFAGSWEGDLLLVAVWARVLTDGEIAALAYASVDEWLFTGPRALWVPKAQEPIADLTGNGAVEILRTGTRPSTVLPLFLPTRTIARGLEVGNGAVPAAARRVVIVSREAQNRASRW